MSRLTSFFFQKKEGWPFEPRSLAVCTHVVVVQLRDYRKLMFCPGYTIAPNRGRQRRPLLTPLRPTRERCSIRFVEGMYKNVASSNKYLDFLNLGGLILNMAVCSSCGRQAGDYVEFQCPSVSCSGKIIRCLACKQNENTYTCTSCGFSGP